MARSTWTIEEWNGSSWVSDGTIYRPNQNADITVTSNQKKMPLADGSNAYVLPEILYSKEPITFFYLEIPETDTFRSKLENYVINQDYVRITTHLGETYTGRFLYAKRVWLTGTTDTYDLEVSFERMA